MHSVVLRACMEFSPSIHSMLVPSHGVGLRYTTSALFLVLSVAHLAFVSTMSLPRIPTNPTGLSALRRGARHLVDAVSNLIKHRRNLYAAFRARMEADRPARDNGWDHFIDLCLRRVLVNDTPPLNAPDVQVQFAAGAVPFGVHILLQLLHHLQVDYG